MRGVCFLARAGINVRDTRVGNKEQLYKKREECIMGWNRVVMEENLWRKERVKLKA